MEIFFFFFSKYFYLLYITVQEKGRLISTGLSLGSHDPFTHFNFPPKASNHSYQYVGEIANRMQSAIHEL